MSLFNYNKFEDYAIITKTGELSRRLLITDSIFISLINQIQTSLKKNIKHTNGNIEYILKNGTSILIIYRR